MKNPEYVIDIQAVSKSFRRRGISSGGYTTLKSALLHPFRKRAASPSGSAVIKDITLRIPQGVSVGVIGRNGSGKSTLLKLITGIYRPDHGTIAVKGRVAALIELGAGFHPDFTGRENLFLGGIMHGLTRREVNERFDAIVEFAELTAVIDEPVRTYSSGMFMRLGFSLAVHTDPDILLIDEVLAVGDAAFEVKCRDKIRQLRSEEKTLLAVTHDLGAIERWCDEALWIEAGEVRERGEPRRVIDEYRSFLGRLETSRMERGEAQETNESEFSTPSPKPSANSSTLQDPSTAVKPKRWGSREIEITDVQVKGSDGLPRRIFTSEDSVTFEIDYAVHQPREEVVFGVAIHRSDGLPVCGTNTQLEGIVVPKLERTGRVLFTVKRLGLIDGTFSFDVAVHAKDGYPFDYHKDRVSFAVRDGIPRVGVMYPELAWEFVA